MKALSLRQPWAHAVLHLGKDIENRVWNTEFRGEFLIHASKGMTKGEYEDVLEYCASELQHAEVFPPFEQVPRGGFVGRARLVDVIRPCVAKAGLFTSCPHRWHMPEQYGFVLQDIRPLRRLVPYLGSLGFFNVPDEVARECGVYP